MPRKNMRSNQKWVKISYYLQFAQAPLSLIWLWGMVAVLLGFDTAHIVFLNSVLIGLSYVLNGWILQTKGVGYFWDYRSVVPYQENSKRGVFEIWLGIGILAMAMALFSLAIYVLWQTFI